MNSRAIIKYNTKCFETKPRHKKKKGDRSVKL